MMKFTQDFNIYTFNFWGGAKLTIESIQKAGKMDDLQLLIEDIFLDKIPSATDINDYVWFEAFEIFNNLQIQEI